MHYTIKINTSDIEKMESVNYYQYMDKASSEIIFEKATYPIFRYYFERTPNIEKVTTKSKKVHEENLPKKSVCICITNNPLIPLLSRLFARQYLYLNKKEATTDIERTWNIIEKSVNFAKIDTVYFSYDHWTKIAYAYRIGKVYNKSIVDITH
jgi:hypothetical protein